MTAAEKLDAHLREIINWHFSPETGCPFWLDWASKNFDPRKEINTFADVKKFPHFQDEWLRDLQPEVWVPAAFKGRPFNIFETGGTTGMPKQRIGWEDYKTDYSEFSEKISGRAFPARRRLAHDGPDRPAPPAPRHRAPRQRPRQLLLLHRPRPALREEAHLEQAVRRRQANTWTTSSIRP